MARIGLDDSRELVILATLTLGRWTLRSSSADVWNEKTAYDVRSLVGGALRAGICRIEDEGRRVRESQSRPRQDQPFRACLAFRVSQSGLLLNRQGGLERSEQ